MSHLVMGVWVLGLGAGGWGFNGSVSLLKLRALLPIFPFSPILVSASECSDIVDLLLSSIEFPIPTVTLSLPTDDKGIPFCICGCAPLLCWMESKRLLSSSGLSTRTFPPSETV